MLGMPLAHHIIFSAYGFWLPNDPRGSWSTYVGSQQLFESAGPATTVTTRASLAHRPHDRRARRQAKRELKFPPVALDEKQALDVALAVTELVEDKRIVVFACAVMPDHVHLVTRTHDLTPIQIVASCRARASRRLHEHGWPSERPIWGKGQWTVFLDTPHDVRSRIAYVERNPTAAGLPPQRWSFVTPYVEHP